MPFVAVKENASFEALPAGVYHCEIASAKNVLSNQKGTPGIKMKFTAHQGSFVATLWCTNKTVSIMQAALRSVGKPVRVGDSFDPQPEDFIGETCRLKIKVNDQGYNEIESWLPPEDSDNIHF